MRFNLGINLRSWALPFALSWRFPHPAESCPKFIAFGIGCVYIVWQTKTYWPRKEVKP